MVGHEGKDNPTGSAIQQHIDKLKRKRGGKAAGSATNGTPRKAPATPKKPTVTKTPTSSAKRKRSTMSEEDDDTEPDMTKARLPEDVGRRNSLPRSGKSATKNYDVDSEDDDGDDEADAKAPKRDDSDKGSDIFNGMINFDGAAESKPAHLPFHTANGFDAPIRRFEMPSTGKTLKTTTPGKSRPKYVDLSDESDVSNFSDAMA